MLPYATMVSRNSTWAPNFLGFRTQMNPVRSSHETHGPEVQEWYLAAWWGPWPRGQRLRGYILELSWLQKQWTIRSGRDFFQSVTSCFFWILICRPNGDLMGFNVDLSRFIDILLFERGSSFFCRFEGMNLIFQHLPISVPEPPAAFGTFPLKRLPWSLKVSKQHSMGSTRMEYGNVWDITRIYMR